MKNIIIKGILFTKLLLVAVLLTAQSDFKPGYIIDNGNDTILGQIDYRGDLLMGRFCKFKTSDNIIKNYFPTDILGYRFANSRYFISRNVNGKNIFLEYLIKGKINLYYLRDENGDHYYIDKDSVRLTEIPYKESVKYIDGKPMLYESTDHIGILDYYTKDAPGFNKEVAKIKKPNRNNMMKLAEEYHNEVCDGEKCIIYENKVPLFKLSIEPVWGLIQYIGSTHITNEFGSNIYFWAPRVNEKLYFKTGIIYNRIHGENGAKSFNQFKIPFQIQYLYPSKKFKPKISTGINFMLPRLNNFYGIRSTLSLNVGFNYSITKSISLSSTINTDYTPFGYVLINDSIHFQLISSSFNIGLYIKL